MLLGLVFNTAQGQLGLPHPLARRYACDGSTRRTWKQQVSLQWQSCVASTVGADQSAQAVPCHCRVNMREHLRAVALGEARWVWLLHGHHHPCPATSLAHRLGVRAGCAAPRWCWFTPRRVLVTKPAQKPVDDDILPCHIHKAQPLLVKYPKPVVSWSF